MSLPTKVNARFQFGSTPKAILRFPESPSGLWGIIFRALAAQAPGKSGCLPRATSSRTCLGKTIWPFSTRANNLLPVSH